jgi:hypothetical protein
MKKLFFNSLLFKVTLLFVLFFGGISFEGKAQEVLTEHRDSVKVILDKAILDISKIASETIINSSQSITTKEKKDEAKNGIKYKDWEAFKNSTAKYGTIKSDVADKYKNSEWIYDISKDSTSIKNYIKELVNNKSIKPQEAKLDEILKAAINKVNQINTPKVVVEPVQDIPVKEEVKKDTSIVPTDEGREIKSEEQPIIPKEYQEYVLLASLGLGLINLLILLYLWNSIGSLRKDVKNTVKNNKNSSVPSEIVTGQYITKRDFEKELAKSNEEILRKLDDLEQKQKTQNSQPKNYKSSVERKIEKQTYIPPVSNQETTIRETKYAKYPSSENGFSASSLKTQNDDEAIYIISINGNQATFEMNQNNREAMQRAMNDTTSFLSKACEFLDVPQSNKKPLTHTEGYLKLIDNVWHIDQKAKIHFV